MKTFSGYEGDMFNATHKTKLVDQVRLQIRTRHYSIKTEETYINWIKRYVFFHNKKHPNQMGEKEINQFLSFLAVKKQVSASTQNQALCALLFLYRHVLQKSLGDFGHVIRAKRTRKIPVVFSRDEVKKIMANLSGRNRLMAMLLYGSGLRIMECLRLRVKDIDFDYKQIIVRDGKGEKDRVTMLVTSIVESLQNHLKRVKNVHKNDLHSGHGKVNLPYALERKYPNANKEWGWQYVFPSSKLASDPRDGIIRRHHLSESALQRVVKAAIKKVGITKPASCHTFRHSFATHLLEDGYDIRTIQELLGHKNLDTTMIYTHVLNKGALSVKSPGEYL